jgi:hypothetical protein
MGKKEKSIIKSAEFREKTKVFLVLMNIRTEQGKRRSA